MTVDPAWVAVGIQTAIFGGGVIYGGAKLSGFLRANTDKIKEVDANLKSHEKEKEPHPSCREHAAQLTAINSSMKQFSRDLGTLDSRIYDIVVNGKKPRGNDSNGEDEDG